MCCVTSQASSGCQCTGHAKTTEDLTPSDAEVVPLASECRASHVLDDQVLSQSCCAGTSRSTGRFDGMKATVAGVCRRSQLTCHPQTTGSACQCQQVPLAASAELSQSACPGRACRCQRLCATLP